MELPDDIMEIIEELDDEEILVILLQDEENGESDLDKNE